MIGAGQRNKRVQVIERVLAEKTAMGPEYTETAGSTYWAQVVELSASERETHKSLGTEITHRVTFNGKRQINYETTEFLVDGKRLKPIDPSSVPAWTYLTSVSCRDVTKHR